MPDRNLASRLQRSLLRAESRIAGPRVDAVSRYILRLAISCRSGHGLRQADRYPAERQTAIDTLSPPCNAAAGSAGVLHTIELQDSRDPVRKIFGDALRPMDHLLLRNEDKPFARSRWRRAGPVQ